MKLAALAFPCLLWACLASAGEASLKKGKDAPPAIQDNSFLIEEAYNQEPNLPLSLVLSERIVTHWNAGAWRIGATRNELGESASTTGYNLGQSLIWMASPRVNLVLEAVWETVEAAVGPGLEERSNSLFINPGIRWSYNFKNGLQIVPGIAVPLGIGPSRGERVLFFYLSLEHPF